MSEMTSKVCQLCALELTLEYFVRDSRTTDQYSNYCVNCRSAIDPGSVDPAQPHMTQTAYCQRCATFHPKSDFTPDRRRRTGVYPWCRRSYAEYQRTYRRRPGRNPTHRTLEDDIRSMIHSIYGPDATPRSVLRSGHAMADRVLEWYPNTDPVRLRQIFYEMCEAEERGESDALSR